MKKKKNFGFVIHPLRVVFALLFITLLTSGFMFFTPDSFGISSKLLHTQFVPSLMSVFAGTSLFFILLMVMTLLFGRVYCSFLCPLGILQDVISRVSSLFKSPKQRRTHYKKPHNILRYSILVIVAICLIIGVSYPLAFLDPYSVYGRIATNIFNSAALGINNLIAGLFPSAVVYEPFVNVSIAAVVVASGFFCLITILSAFWGRIYCNAICPVGSFLGLLSEAALFRLTIDEDKCVGCGICATHCKSGCIDPKNKKVDYSRCVMCFDCVKSCSTNAYKYSFSYGKKTVSSKKCDDDPENAGRRNALIALGSIGVILVSRKWGNKLHPAVSGEDNAAHIIPPGSISLNHLKEHCTACHACVAACPQHIIHPALGEHGLDGFMMPLISFKNGSCNYDCNACSLVCPAGAIKPLSIESKRVTKIGTVKFTAKNCMVFKTETNCGLCSEHCPTGAITMVDFKKKDLKFPSVHRDICIGCGGCEHVCPASPKAMTVVPVEEQSVISQVSRGEVS